MSVKSSLLLCVAVLLAVSVSLRDVEAAKREVSTCKNGYENVPGSTMCLTDSPDYVPNSAKGVSEDDKKIILQKHNEYRSSVIPTAQNLEKMYWDDELAALAEKWAKQCVLAHEGDRDKTRFIPAYGMNPGQNVAVWQTTWDDAIGLWFKEKRYFVYGERTVGRVTGHYTQMIQAGSILVGCGFANCTNTWFPNVYVCNYLGPQYNVTYPYASGNSCDSCPDKCNDKLCDCEGKFCFNGGTLDFNTCECKCRDNYYGPTCGGLKCPPTDEQYCGEGNFYPPDKCFVWSSVPHSCPWMCKRC